MAIRLDISLKKLVDTEFIRIGTLGEISNFQIDVIPATTIPTSFEVQETESYIPSKDILKESIDRLSIVISRISKVASVSSSGTVISITFISGVTDISFVSSVNIILVRIIQDNGTSTSFNDPFVTNITVTSVVHGLHKFPFPSLSNPFGNMGDLQETTILFTAADSFSICNFFYGWIDNDTTIYPNPSDFQIDVENFKDIRTGALQKFTGDTSTFNAVAPLEGDKVDIISLTNLGGDNYRLVILHYIPIFPQNLSNEFPAQINTSLKMVFQIDLLQDLINTDQLESTSEQNLSSFLGLGNVGYLNEVYRTGQQFYKLNSINWANPENQLNAGADTVGTIIIEKLNGNFDATHEGIINYSKVTDVFDQELTQLENLKLNTLDFLFDGSLSTDSVFKDVNVSFAGNLATITFTVLATKIQNEYFLWVNLWDGVTNYANQNVLVQFGTVASLADESVIDFGTYPGALIDEYNYDMHYTDDVANSYNQTKSFVDDIVLSRFRVVNSDIVNTVINQFTIRIKQGNNILETFNIDVDDLPYSLDRNYNLLINDARRFIKVETDGLGNYDFIYPFQINEEWISEGITQETIANCTQTNAIADIDFSNNWISPQFQLGNYNQTKNTFADPQVVAPPSKIQYFDEAGLIETGAILLKEKTLVIATFEESNLNDLLCLPAAPYTYLNNDYVVNYLTAYFGLEVNGQYFRFHNLKDNEDSMFEQIIGVDYYPTLERTDIKTATLKAYIDPDKLKKLVGADFDCIQITARLDKIGQVSPISLKAYKNNSYSSGYS